MSLKKALLAATILALPAVANAQSSTGIFGMPAIGANPQAVTGLYIGGGAGWNLPSNSDLSFDTLAANSGVPLSTASGGKLIWQSGYVGLASIGWGFGNGLRVEVEGNVRRNWPEKVNGFAPLRWGSSNAGGRQTTYGVMGNVFYDFDLGNFGLAPSLVQPYIGVGAGYAWNQWTRVRATSVSGVNFVSTSEDGNFAYQAIVGAAFPLTRFGVPGLSLTAEYRFFGTLDPSFSTRVFNTTTGQPIAGGKLSSQNLNNSVLLGLRYAFYTPPPPAPPVVAPAPSPARTYLVFFDWDRADLTPRAREIVTEAAQNAKTTQTTRIDVAGHADRSGSAQYNQRLSQRRAETVAGELVRNGIGRNEISVTAFGETRPLVPTADGVREPQNRRVEIVLR